MVRVPTANVPDKGAVMQTVGPRGLKSPPYENIVSTTNGRDKVRRDANGETAWAQVPTLRKA